MSEEPLSPGTIEILGSVDQACQEAADYAMDALRSKVGDKMPLIQQFKVRFFKSDTDRGARVDSKRKEIVVNRTDAAMSLQESEDYLVAEGIYDPGETTRLLPDIKDKPWSTLVFQLVHESGHNLDELLPGDAYNRLDPELSPTKYGKKEPREAFPEAFTYWVFDAELDPEAKKVVEDTISQHWGEP